MTRGTTRKLAFALLLSIALAVPGLAQPGSPDPGGTAIFRLLVGELARSPDEGVLLVDPRQINPGADLLGVEDADLGSSSAQREQALSELGVQRTDFLVDKLCMWANGLPPAPGYDALSDSVARVRQGCRSRPPFTSVVIGAPRAVNGDAEATVAVTVAGMTTSTYFVRDYFLRSVRGEWRVVRTEQVIQVWS